MSGMENQLINNHSDEEPPAAGLRILIADQQSLLTVEQTRLQAAVRQILVDAGLRTAVIGIAVVDDQAIHALNRQYLQHDYPTDVLSFPLEQNDGHLEGEVVVSADTADCHAKEAGWSASDELLLYVIHGMLHLVGFRDKRPDDIAAMRCAELKYLQQAGAEISASDQRWHAADRDNADAHEKKHMGGLQAS